MYFRVCLWDRFFRDLGCNSFLLYSRTSELVTSGSPQITDVREAYEQV